MKCQQTETTCTILWIVHYRLVHLIREIHWPHWSPPPQHFSATEKDLVHPDFPRLDEMSTNWNYVYYIEDCTLQVGEFDIVKYWPHWSPTPQTFLRTGKGIGPPQSPPIRENVKLKLRVLYCGLHLQVGGFDSWNLLAPLVPTTPNISPHRKRIWSTPIAPD